MKILYAIQTTGNGHLARAQNIIPKIKEVAELEIITSGPKNDFLLEEKPIKHFTGVTFFYTDNGSVNWLKTVFLNNYFRLLKEILSCPVKKYDLIINDFEPVSAWSAKFNNVKWINANAEKLPIPSDFYDYYTISFGIRNVTNINSMY